MSELPLWISLSCLMLGALQGVSPDRVLPLAVASWQRGLSIERAQYLALIRSSFEGVLGLCLGALALVLTQWLPNSFGVWGSSGAVALALLIRALRYPSQMNLVFQSGGQTSFLRLILWAGPLELWIPLALQLHARGVELLPASGLFVVGYLIASVASAHLAHRRLESPVLRAALLSRG